MAPAMARAPGTATEQGTYNQQFIDSIHSVPTPKPPVYRRTPDGDVLMLQEYLRSIAGADFFLLDRIVMCESGYHATAQNRASSAGGIFQFIDSTWAKWGTGEKYDPYGNMDAGVRLFRAQGTSPWNASRSCWE